MLQNVLKQKIVLITHNQQVNPIVEIILRINVKKIDTVISCFDNHLWNVGIQKNRYVSVSWSFYDLEQKLIYKAKQNQSSVIKVDPHYTSQCCPCCGHVEKSNRNKKIHLFTCKKCGYKSNDDRIGAMNLYRMGINYLADSQVPNTVVTE